MRSQTAPPLGFPEEVRRDLVELAALVLAATPEIEVPPSLRRVKGFTPARRARSGAAPLAMALERETGFRQVVGAAWRTAHPELAESLEAGRIPDLAEPRAVLAGTYLLRPQGWEEMRDQLVATLTDGDEQHARDERENAAEVRLGAVQGEVLSLRLEAEQARRETTELREEVTVLRRETRRLRSDADRARAQARAAVERAEQVEAAARVREQALGVELDQARERVTAALQQVDLLRRAERDGRSLGESRARLLLDTIVDAATGLRRELALPPVSLLPGDAVAGGALGEHTQVPAARALAADDPVGLDRLLGLPRAHLVVDGYNVTKEGYGSASLSEQRRRLVEGLVALRARTGAEVTCCFDGAEVDSVSATWHRGVRVLFSEPGRSADDLILRLVRAEPRGRAVVVVSSDGEVAAGARAARARSVPSTALLRLLARG